jgi:hemerythrin-like metal-binding protein
MPYFSWSPAYSIGLKEIDLQHKSLVQAVNALHEALHTQGGARDLGWMLDFLAHYTVEHFQAEETLMDSTGYPRTEAHTRIHKELLGQVGEFLGRYQHGTEDISEGLLDFLKQWLMVHIGEEDRRLGAHVQLSKASQAPVGSGLFNRADPGNPVQKTGAALVTGPLH